MELHEVVNDMNDDEIIIVTNHEVTYEFIIENYVGDRPHKWLDHVTHEDIQGKVVWGVLPLHYACYCHLYVTIPVLRPKSAGRAPLTYEDFEQYARKPVVYSVDRLGEIEDTLDE